MWISRKNDVTFATPSNEEIIAFNTKILCEKALIKHLGVKIMQHIAYEVIEKLRVAMANCYDFKLHEGRFSGI